MFVACAYCMYMRLYEFACIVKTADADVDDRAALIDFFYFSLWLLFCFLLLDKNYMCWRSFCMYVNYDGGHRRRLMYVLLHFYFLFVIFLIFFPMIVVVFIHLNHGECSFSSALCSLLLPVMKNRFIDFFFFLLFNKIFFSIALKIFH